MQRGIPLTVRIAVRDARKACSPVVDAQVDVWHCNAAGAYSDEPGLGTATQTWLRGYRRTDANGLVTFITIFPGWYQGRATHIHLRVRSAYSEASDPSDETNTTQLFFPQAAVDAVSASALPYRARGANPLTNARDHVYALQTNGMTLATLRGSIGTGFTAELAVNLPISRGTG